MREDAAMRSLHNATKSGPHSQQLEKACVQQRSPGAATDKEVLIK